MLLQKALRASLALVLACGLASFSRAIVPTALSVAAGVVAGAAVGAAASTPYHPITRDIHAGYERLPRPLLKVVFP
jgi:hypothetical protein